MKQCSIYKATNTITNKCYIGQTVKTIGRRWYLHVWEAQNHTSRSYLHNSILKHGPEAFNLVEICKCETKEIANIMETFYIMVSKSHCTEDGYNLTWGGDGPSGVVISEETRRKLSISHTGLVKSESTRKLMGDAKRGVPKSEEHKRKLSEANTGKKLSQETIAKITIASTGRLHTDEAKRKISIAHTGKKRAPESVEKQRQKVGQWWKITHPSGEEEIIFSLTAFCNEHRLQQSCMSGVANGRAKQHKGGWRCEKVQPPINT